MRRLPSILILAAGMLVDVLGPGRCPREPLLPAGPAHDEPVLESVPSRCRSGFRLQSVRASGAAVAGDDAAATRLATASGHRPSPPRATGAANSSTRPGPPQPGRTAWATEPLALLSGPAATAREAQLSSGRRWRILARMGRVGQASPSEARPTNIASRHSVGWWQGARYARLAHPTKLRDQRPMIGVHVGRRPASRVGRRRGWRSIEARCGWRTDCSGTSASSTPTSATSCA